MQIRKQQLDALGEVRARDFVLRLSDELERIYPEEVAELSREELASRIAASASSAQRFGIEEESDLAKLVYLQCELGWDFAFDLSLPWVSDILESDLSGPEKVEALWARADDDLEEEDIDDEPEGVADSET